jgi:hypothetical protein
MKIRAQIAMVLNLDKRIGCGTTPPAPALPPPGEKGVKSGMHLSIGVGEQA